MAIDPKLYEKYSGRSSDPTRKLGEALAQSAGRGRRETSGSPVVDGMFAGLRFRWWLSIIGSLLVMAAVVTAMISPAAVQRFKWSIFGGGPQQGQTQPTPETP